MAGTGSLGAVPTAPAPSEELRAKVARLTQGPGVYRWRDAQGRTLYVGKAANLRARVRSYLGVGDGRHLLRLLMRRAVDVDVVPTATAEEALLLENTLIKQERPPYNLRLKDDKAYLLIRVDRRHAFPRLTLVRKVKRDRALYLGPFASAKSVRRTLRFLRTLFPLRTCSDRELEERTRPCLYHQIGRCAAPCVDLIGEDDYKLLVEGTLAVLRGRDDGLLASLRRDMGAAAEGLEFERAAVLRDRADALEGALARQEVVSPDGRDRDVVAVAMAGGVAMLGIVYVRDGHVVATRAWPERTALARRDVLGAFLAQFYAKGKVVPAEVLVEEAPDDVQGIEEVLGELRGSRVAVRVPQRGPGRDLLDLARRHAAEALREHGERARAARAALERLAEVLGLDAPPERIEGYDLSHLKGTDPVAALSVLVGGVADPAAYRHFAVREAAGGDDYGGMREIVRRRFAAGEHLGERPDLLLIDGGRGQLEAAAAAFADLGIEPVPMVGLAKARSVGGVRTDERIVRRDVEAPLVLAVDDPALRLLVRARDEAHRFAGRYQRQRRSVTMAQGALEGIPGVGAARRKRLLTHFGSVEAIRRAPFEDVAALPGIGEHLARRVRERLEGAAAREGGGSA